VALQRHHIVETEFLARELMGSLPRLRQRLRLHSARGCGDFDDSKWEVIAPTSLSQRRGTGRLGFNWYRISLTVPEQIDGFPTSGSTAVFETSLDDYARYG